jgi:hypothetical protein
MAVAHIIASRECMTLYDNTPICQGAFHVNATPKVLKYNFFLRQEIWSLTPADNKLKIYSKKARRH